MLSRYKEMVAHSIRLLFALSGVAVFAATSSSATSALVMSEDFESGTLGHFKPSGNSPVVTSEQARAGGHSMKTTLSRLDSPTSYRTEVTTGIGAMNAQFFSDTWYGVSVFLPSSYVKSPVWEIVFQWHGVADFGKVNPPMSMHTENGEWMLSTIGDSRRPADKENYESKERFQLGSYAADLDQWTDWVFRIRWDYRKIGSGNDGMLQAWKNGVLVVNESPIQLGFNHAVGPYFKMGIYKGWNDRKSPFDTVSERVLYHDEFRQAGAGGSYDSVAPQGGKPQARPVAPRGVEVR